MIAALIWFLIGFAFGCASLAGSLAVWVLAATTRLDGGVA